MPKITKITTQSTNTDRISIFADGKFLIGLDQLTWAKLDLRVGSELTTALIDRLKQADTDDKCYNKALKLLSFRPQSKCELRQKLSKRFAADTITATLARLAKEKLVDDERFAALWVNERIITRHRSIQHLMAELRQKGIERSIVQSVISKLGQPTEVEAAVGLAKRSTHQPPEKLRAYLARRGFGYSVIREVERRLQAQE